jgi:DNA-binding GntR family transcriptional regulator
LSTKNSSTPVTLKIKIDTRSTEPKSWQVALQIKKLIEGGRLRPGDMLPSEDGLAEQLGVGRKVVRQAYGRLVEERLLVRDFPRNKRVAGSTKKATNTKKAVSEKKVGTTKSSSKRK